MTLASTYPPMRGLAQLPWYFGMFGTSASDSSASSISDTRTPSASSTIHTKGAWTQVVASLAEDCNLIILSARELSQSGVETSMLLDVGVGAAGSESPIVSNIAIGGAPSGGNGFTYALVFFLPVRVAAGSRIAIRTQAAIASDTVQVSFSFFKFSNSPLMPTSLDVMGTDTATSRGTSMSGSSGTYVELAASTSQRYRALVIVPSVPTNTVTNTTNVKYTVAAGAAGSESDLGSIFCVYNNAEFVNFPGVHIPFPIACDVPAGSRISVKHDIASNPQDFACCVIGVP